MGITEALESAGRLKDVVMSPADEYNGWLKWVAQNKKAGVVTFPTRAGQVATQIGMDILAGKPVNEVISCRQNTCRQQKSPSILSK